MAKTGKCKACGNLVSKKAKFCPHCGEKKPYKDTSETFLSILLMVVFGLFILGSLGSESSNENSSNKRDENSYSAKKVCREDYTACPSNEALMEGHHSKAAVSCEMAIQRIAKYGTPEFGTPGFFGMPGFYKYAESEDSLKTGLITLFENNVMMPNVFGAKVRTGAVCQYDLSTKDVKELYIEENGNFVKIKINH